MAEITVNRAVSVFTLVAMQTKRIDNAVAIISSAHFTALLQ